MMQTWITFSTFFYFGVRISMSDLLLRRIRNIDLGYFATASILANFDDILRIETDSFFWTLATCLALYIFLVLELGLEI